MTHPVTHDAGGADTRYTVEREWCGYETPRYVARYCGEWIGQSISYASAAMLCVGHDSIRKGAEPIVAMEA